MKTNRKKKLNSIEMLQTILCTDTAKIEGCTLRFEILLTGLLLKLTFSQSFLCIQKSQTVSNCIKF